MLIVLLIPLHNFRHELAHKGASINGFDRAGDFFGSVGPLTASLALFHDNLVGAVPLEPNPFQYFSFFTLVSPHVGLVGIWAFVVALVDEIVQVLMACIVFLSNRGSVE